MASKKFLRSLSRDLPVLFVNIGWAIYYDGTEPIRGGHRYLRRDPETTAESHAFTMGANGTYECGIGAGEVADAPLHIVFVASNPLSHTMYIVGIYASASVRAHRDDDSKLVWATALSKHAVLVGFPRTQVVLGWPTGQGMRRWAIRKNEKGISHPKLQELFGRIKRELAIVAKISSQNTGEDMGDDENSAREGALLKSWIAHRKRESKLRHAKTKAALDAVGGRLVCEVPGCGFDFAERYGDLGYGFAHVHHKRPLGQASVTGRKVTLDELAIVCANCHAMIHRWGECRPLTNLLNKGKD